MKTIETKNQFIFESTDEYGEFQFCVHKSCNQIQLNTNDSEAFADVNRIEIKEIIKILQKALEYESN